MHLPERDGIFTDLMLLDLFVCGKGAGVVAGEARRSSHLHRDRRALELCGAVDIHFDQASYPALKDRLLAELPRPGSGGRWPEGLVVRTQPLSTNDGFKFFAR